jgi:WD40 repeat protein
MIQQAITAYELAVATQARIASEAARNHKRRLKDLAAEEAVDTGQRQDSHRERIATAEAEAERVATLSALATDLTESASALLDRAALAHVRGFGPGSTDVGPHIATDEQAAAAFTAAQLASVNVSGVLLKLAQEYLEGKDWARAQDVSACLPSGSAGPMVAEALAVNRAACLGEVREALSDGDPEAARSLAEAWLRAHRQDDEMAGLLLQAVTDLLVQAESSGDQRLVESEVTAVLQQHHADDQGLREVMRRHPQVAWRVGRGRILSELGTHRLPVRAVAFSADGRQLVSADETDVTTWDLGTVGSAGSPVHTVALTGLRGLSPDGALALGKDGILRRTSDGNQVRQIGAIAAHAFSSDSSLLAWTARDGNQWDYATMRGKMGSTEASRLYSLINEYYKPVYQESPVEYKVEGAFPANQKAGYVSIARFIDSLRIAEIPSSQALRRVALDDEYCLFMDIDVSVGARKVGLLTPEGQVLVINLDSGVKIPLFKVNAAQSLLNCIAFSPDGSLILVAQAFTPATGARAADNRTAMTIWDISRGSVLWSWTTSRREGAIAFSPDGQLIATLAMDGTVSLFDVRAKQALPELGSGGFHGALTSPCLAFSPDGSRLAASGYREVKVWGL